MPWYTEQEARDAIRASLCYSEALRRLGLRPAGGNHALFRRYVDEVWKISTDHFAAWRPQQRGLNRASTPLSQVLVEHSTYSRSTLKRRLYEAGLKQRRCELCGQGEEWRGQHMALILDHINGVPDDNRIENLRVVCPNCAATFDTHCGRHNQRPPEIRACAVCGKEFRPNSHRQRHCSQACGTRHANRRHGPFPELRRVERPPYEQLIAETQALGFSAVGRKYGVTDNAVRKWIRWYEAATDRREGGDDH